jgi:hypothetical protein
VSENEVYLDAQAVFLIEYLRQPARMGRFYIRAVEIVLDRLEENSPERCTRRGWIDMLFAAMERRVERSPHGDPEDLRDWWASEGKAAQGIRRRGRKVRCRASIVVDSMRRRRSLLDDFPGVLSVMIEDAAYAPLRRPCELHFTTRVGLPIAPCPAYASPASPFRYAVGNGDSFCSLAWS